MKRKLVLGLIAGMLVAVSGCGKEVDDVSKSQELEQIREENAKDNVDVEQVNETTEKVESDSSKEPVKDSGKEKTGYIESGKYKAYPEEFEFIRIPMGEEVNGEITVPCSIIIPKDYIVSGGGFNPEGERKDLYFSSNTAATLEELAEEVQLDGAVANMLVSGDGTAYSTLDFRMYPASEVTVESEKEYAPDGVEIGSSDMPGYAYKDPESVDTLNHVNFCTTIQVSEDLTLMLWCESERYKGMSVEEIGNAFYELVRKE